LCAASDE
jgi:hypothetical protein